jgi:hypothetical protein
MKTESLHFGMRVRHPQYGVGTVKSISEHTADIRFEDLVRTVSPETGGLEPAEPQISVQNLELPWSVLISETVQRVIEELGLERPGSVVEQLGARWRNGNVILKSGDGSTQPKEIPLETFFHKIVMVRNNLRVLEQKINAHPVLTDADKVELQQYITRSYGSLTTFNVLFKNEGDKFRGASEG